MRWLTTLLLAVVGLMTPTSAAAEGCSADVLLSPDYAKRSASYVAHDVSAECLEGWATRGLPFDTPNAWRTPTEDRWSVPGRGPDIPLTAHDDGSWTLSLDLDLQPDDLVRLVLPF